MSVKLILANTYNQAFNEVVGCLKRASSQKNVVIVPDKFSLSSEREIMAGLDAQGSFNCKVMTFTRLAEKTLKHTIKRCLTPEGSVMLLQSVINSSAADLVSFKNAKTTAGFAKEMYAVLTAMRNSGIGVSDLNEKTKGFSAYPALRAKITDIALLYERYIEKLTVSHSDSGTRLQALAEIISGGDAKLGGDSFADLNFYFYDFFAFTQPQYDIISALFTNASSVTIGLVHNDRAPNQRLYPVDTVRKIEKLAADCGVMTDKLYSNENLTSAKKAVAERMFSYDGQPPEENHGYCELYTAPDRYGEVVHTAGYIRRLIVENNYRYSDIGVAVSSLSAYSDLIEKVFARFDIPFFINRKERLINQPAVRFLFSVLEAATDNKANLSTVLNVCKSPIFYEGFCDYNEIENFELYCQKYYYGNLNIQKPFVLGSAEEIEPAQKIRLRYLDCIIAAKTGKKTTAADFLDAAEKVLKQNGGAFESTEKAAERLKEKQRRIYMASAQAQGKLADIFYEMRLTVGQDEMTADEFLLLLKSALSDIEIAITPVLLDSIIVAEPFDNRFDGCRALFVLGATDGQFPVGGAATTVITVGEEKILVDGGLLLSPTKKQNSKYELFNIAQLLIKASEKLVVSYPKFPDNGESKPTVCAQLTQLLCEKGDNIKIYKTFEGFTDIRANEAAVLKRYAYKFGTLKNAEYEILTDIVNKPLLALDRLPYDAAYALLDETQKNEVNRYLSGQQRQTVSGGSIYKRRKRISASMLENYFGCPYRCFLNYGAGIKPPQSGQIDGRVKGTFIHAVLEKFFTAGQYPDKRADCDRAVKDIAKSVQSGEDFALYISATQKNTFKRLTADCCDVCWNLSLIARKSHFKPIKLEAKIGFDADSDYKGYVFKTADGTEFEFGGYIDRVDGWDRYLAVYDYKSYTKGFDPKSVYTGTNIQMPLYLAAVLQSEGVRPAAVLYIPVGAKYSNDEEGRYRADGIVIDDLPVLEALSGGALEKGKHSFLPISGKIDGMPQKSDKVLSATEFDAVLKYAKAVSEGAVNEFCEGYIDARPAGNACNFCDYREVCPSAFDADKQRDFEQTVKFKDFKFILDGKAEGN